jgi:hypothetical protein
MIRGELEHGLLLCQELGGRGGVDNGQVNRHLLSIELEGSAKPGLSTAAYPKC